MSIKALIYGGIQITGITPPKAASQYDGIWFEMRGATQLLNGSWTPAGITVEMSYKDASDFIMAIYLALEKHGKEVCNEPKKLVNRMQKRLSKEEKE
jgi:hypothetical protein